MSHRILRRCAMASSLEPSRARRPVKRSSNGWRARANAGERRASSHLANASGRGWTAWLVESNTGYRFPPVTAMSHTCQPM